MRIHKGYTIEVNIDTEQTNKKKKRNLMKIYRFVYGIEMISESMRMVGYNKAEVICRKIKEPNRMLKEYGKLEKYFWTSIPRIKFIIRGEIHKWDGTLDKLRRKTIFN